METFVRFFNKYGFVTVRWEGGWGGWEVGRGMGMGMGGDRKKGGVVGRMMRMEGGEQVLVKIR